MDQWVRVPDQRPARPAGGAAPRRPRAPLPPALAAEIRTAAVGATAHHREVLVQKTEDAVEAYERNRYADAIRLGKSVAEEAPGVAAVRELVGLAAYRAGRWREAVKHLEAHREMTGDPEHVAVLMDCQRALGRPRKVADLYTDLRQESPDPDVLAEARIVAAGSLADQGDLAGAISLLGGAGAAKALRNPGPRHVRQWYALADLYERAGDIPKARELFARVQRADPGAYGVADRMEALGGAGPPARRVRAASRRVAPTPTAAPGAPRGAPRPAAGDPGGEQ